MTGSAIAVQGLGKAYRLAHHADGKRYRTLRDDLIELIKSPFRAKGSATSEVFWALEDVSFEVTPGQVVGLIGRNGAGKSTLLKILARITQPTIGHATITGRVGSLLEVGTGFHPELTGRENIFLNGAVLGMERREIERKFDEIVAFADVEKFLDTPAKRYSSGMYMRLAFAVAAHLEPEILLVDEVLAVGDSEFQKKSIGKMNDIARSGRTVLFVSHSMTAVQSLCDRAIWLSYGKIEMDGLVEEVVGHYVQAGASNQTEQTWPDLSRAPGNDRVRITAARIRPVNGAVSDDITIRTSCVVEFEYVNLDPGAKLNLSVVLRNFQGIDAFNTFPIDETGWLGMSFPKGKFKSVFLIPGDLLNDGLYLVDLLVVQNQSVVIHNHPEILAFDVIDSVEMRGDWHGRFIGAVRPYLKWTTTMIEQFAE